MPDRDREDPWFHTGIVQIGATRIPIDIEDISYFRPLKPVCDPTGRTIDLVSLCQMTHPFSLRAEPRSRNPADLDMAGATRAVEHMRGAWMKSQNHRLRPNSSPTDVVIT
ncbi:hypothetical protein [Ensifer sp.]|jgi:hypothetical protein|uniref:hypothetical protein n=1 Tax=Ensifer sp. TaxID=1872086 RepID=UPI002E12CDF2|nr:hypothetical protein [Ensifer sp.]